MTDPLLTMQSIVAAVDFGVASARAVSAAGLIAERCHSASLTLMHAETIAAPPYFTPDQVDTLERQRDATRAQAEQFVLTFGRQHTQTPFSVVIQNREPVDAILRESRHADLVVMGTHGRHGAKRWWLGSVAERVLESVDVPLLVMPAASHANAAFSRLLVHSSELDGGGAAFAYATQLGACFNGTVIDGRGRALDDAVREVEPTSVVAAAPVPHSMPWLSAYAYQLVEFSRIPVLFIPERTR